MYCVDFVADKVVSGGRDKHLKMWGQTSFGCFVFTDCMTVDGRTENETVGPIPLSWLVADRLDQAYKMFNSVYYYI